MLVNVACPMPRPLVHRCSRIAGSLNICIATGCTYHRSSGIGSLGVASESTQVQRSTPTLKRASSESPTNPFGPSFAVAAFSHSHCQILRGYWTIVASHNYYAAMSQSQWIPAELRLLKSLSRPPLRPRRPSLSATFRHNSYSPVCSSFASRVPWLCCVGSSPPSHGQRRQAGTSAAQAATAHPRSMPLRRASGHDFGLPIYCKACALSAPSPLLG